jgi:hypothetical protein
MSDDIRILLLADSHLGFDLPVRPRVGRRRRGYDFLANNSAALAPALAGEVDLVVHAGDVFDRSSVLPTLAYQAYEPLRRVADLGVPVFIVPGNHERSRLPHARFATHPGVHIFDTPRTFVARVRGTTIGLRGFTSAAIFPERAGIARDQMARARLHFRHHPSLGRRGASVVLELPFTTAPTSSARAMCRRTPGGVAGVYHCHQVLTTDMRVVHSTRRSSLLDRSSGRRSPKSMSRRDSWLCGAVWISARATCGGSFDAFRRDR